MTYKKTILVTGGLGFMGSAFIRHMLAKYPDYRIICFDKVTYAANHANLVSVKNHPNYFFIKGDIADKDAVWAVMSEGVDIVVNFAAETHVDRSIHGARDFVMTDVVGTQTLLEAVREFKIERMIQISTDEVYGSTTEGSFSEDHPLEPNSPYAASKAGGDLQCRAYFKTHGVPVIVTHSVNNYGPYQYPEKVIPLFVTNLLQDQKVPLYGDGKNVREWLYVDDHSRAIDVLIHRGVLGEVYNIGSGYRVSNFDLTVKILRLLGKDKKMIERVDDRKGHDFRYAVECKKLCDLGWKVKTTFDSSLSDTVDWYKNNLDWWEPIKDGSLFKKWEKAQYK